MSTATAPTAAPASRRTWLLRGALSALLMLALFAAFTWWSTHWRPDRSVWPAQGVAIGPANAPVSWPGLASQGATFAYIDAVTGGTRAQSSFTAQRAAARTAGLRVGAIHHYALCQLASDQAAAFVTLVPRDADALPPAVVLDIDANCPHQPTRALLLSELTTFLNQLETHIGKPAIIAPSDEFEAKYAIGDAINRAMWLRRNWRAPAAEGPAWVIWQANDRVRVAGSTGATRWLVLHDGGPDGVTS